ncbi:ATP-binding protein [Streptomyces sp. NBC_01716]|uniref:ATP-binding protein n=1 Tax=Streptomyces sp. NBC_01716 TaxID=2975917 RepID=UPI002E3742E5|nr:ATP-binding protein [Streptomyces sp. NBC_01716]
MPSLQAQEAVTVRVFNQRFSATRRGARLARRLATQQLDAWGIPYGSEPSDAAVLVVAELAANAVLHGRVPGRDFALRLAYNTAKDLVRIEVSDTHGAMPMRAPRGVAADGEHGRGLVLVDAVALQWGVSGRTGPGKTVWAYVPASHEGA